MCRHSGRATTASVVTGTSSHAAPASDLIPIYGRRRVGKSELILRFLRDKPGIYFVGKKAPEQLQLREFLQEAAIALDAQRNRAFARRQATWFRSEPGIRWLEAAESPDRVAIDAVRGFLDALPVS